MKIDGNTKVIGRFHKKMSQRGLNIYNPFFQETGINAIFVLFYNLDPKPLIQGMRSLNLTGAVTAGFESNEDLPGLLDKLDPVAKYVQRVGFVTNENGMLTGFSQGGLGLLRTIQKTSDLRQKSLHIIGAGHVVRALLFNLKEQKILTKEIHLYNRSVENLAGLDREYKLVTELHPLTDLNKAAGDVLVNVTHIGGSVEDTLYTNEIVANFKAVVDVTFEKEDTNLIKIAQNSRLEYATGWDMFTFQGQIVLETILKTKINAEILKKYVRKGLSEEVS